MLTLALLFAGHFCFAEQNHPTNTLSKLLPTTMQPQSAKSDFEQAMEKSAKLGDNDPKVAGNDKTCILPMPKVPLKSGQNPTEVNIPNPPVPQGPKFPIFNSEDQKNCLDRGGSIQYQNPTAGH